ncbi:hypothetical protein DFP98_113200 [Cohnella phaseoli]|uniref:Uncharacterized protein n=1 Tax=Cohnella phaseoli TaxID=456490 RepID=A0A3D9JQR7_9BACL|nr:hypothetical protein DFP98_113200 [Cohnella phaseoli]
MTKTNEKTDTVTMIVDKEQRTVRFDCEGDVWRWLVNWEGLDLWGATNEVLNSILEKDVRKFYYDIPLFNFISNFRRFVDKIVFVN